MQNNFGLSSLLSLVRKLRQGNGCAFTLFCLYVHVFAFTLAGVKNHILESLCVLMPSLSRIFPGGTTC